ncbi:RNA polymerase II-associated protein 3-like isoform X2 [Chenopodium quinoa]|uniref:RNA polymerase II-associated protein 3-like isoform X2 n=1 Tax=Chenopodium quinoa TaxID=63459 RepID=UPI000B785D9A|nr:RNA polymerase II-associated protein 3-like isoform X2 [Chenopodium quinoa]
MICKTGNILLKTRIRSWKARILERKLEVISENKRPDGKINATSLSSSTSQHRPPVNYDPVSHISTTLMTDENTVDAASEKDLGNEYFKQKKFNEAIDCYSRSIALSPTAVAYANRAMAYLKIKRFQEAEDDCTEALNLDDRYIKAYSRRATARKELRKLRDSLEDVEFALRLEPQNEDLKKQRSEVKSLLEKAIFAKAAGTATRAAPSVKEVKNKVDANGHENPVLSASERSKKSGVDVLSDSIQLSANKSSDSGNTVIKSKSFGEKNGKKKNYTSGKKELGPSVQELASRAASRAREEAAKKISTPNSAYQFEVTWRGFCGDRSLQAQLLKVTQPDALPQIFKNALTAPLLIDIVKCIATFFIEETELAVKYLENLTRIPRFDMIIMCLSPADKAELCRTWDEEFLGNATPVELVDILSKLHPRYCPRQ